MSRHLLSLGCLAVLCACGQGASRPGGPGASEQACALVAEPVSVFGEGVEQVGYGRLETMAASCQFQSADGARSGEVVISTVESLGSRTPEAEMAERVQSWDGMTDAPLVAVEGLGDEARMATDLPGYQTQIIFRQGSNVVMVSGSSGDDAMSGEQIARHLARAASQSLASSGG